ncbi:MAG TPA: MFS transporter [Ramlibacter sp.]|jgi:MFS family permease|uniref:MFS transporter n=1 Tax=Ramlibacter sp. TaxID=1917967 RepID=UPI002D684349|nr:MFS transporter [Ramlibacter sp.]HZY16899.1 MFS transporter [Ramlibacter sp.]
MSAPPAAPASPASDLATCLRLTVLLTVTHASFGGARLTLTLQAVQWHATPLAVGLLVSLLMLVPALVSVHIGRWADRAGHVPPTVAGLAALAAGELLAACAGHLALLAAASVLVGTGYTLCHVAINHAIGIVAGTQGRVRAFGVTALGFSLSALAGPLVAGWLIDQVGHAWTFALLTLGPAASGLMLAGLRHASGPARTAAAARAGLLDLLRHAPVRTVLVSSALVAMGWDLFTFLVPLHAEKQGLSATAIGLVVGTFGIGSFAARLALPALVRTLEPRQLLHAAVLLAAAGYLVLPFCGTVASMLPLAFVVGLVLGCGQPLVMTLLLEAAPAGRAGEAVGLRTALTSLGQTALPLVFGALGAAVGMLPLFWAVAATMAGGSLASRRRPRR